jgi:serine/threonine protein kinase
VDVWSIGVMLFACLTGTLPFSADESDLKALLRLIILHEPEIPASVPSDARNLLKGMLQKDPQRRIQVRRYPSPVPGGIYDCRQVSWWFTDRLGSWGMWQIIRFVGDRLWLLSNIESH